MNDFVRLLLLLALAGMAVTALGGVAIWYMDEERRLRRALKHVLKAKPEAELIARGRGRAIGFHFATNQAAVAWDGGAWCLIYRIDELMGAELIVDGQVVARAYRGEPRRALDRTGGAESEVTLRLVFDDPQNPDFELELWQAGDETRRDPLAPAKAVQIANRWLARAESILRRSAAAAAPAAEPPRPPSPPPAPPPPAPAAIPGLLGDDDGLPPWDEDDPEGGEPADDSPDKGEALT